LARQVSVSALAGAGIGRKSETARTVVVVVVRRREKNSATEKDLRRANQDTATPRSAFIDLFTPKVVAAAYLLVTRGRSARAACARARTRRDGSTCFA